MTDLLLHEIVLKGPLANHLTAAAQKRNVPPVELLADIIEAVLNDNLIDAVLDDQKGTE